MHACSTPRTGAQLLAVAALATALTSTLAAQIPAGPVRIVLINTTGAPKNVVPGIGGTFKPGGTSNATFVRPWFSDNEAHFMIEAFANVATTQDDIYLLDGGLFLQEGTTAPWNPAEQVGVLDDDVGLDNSGNVLVTQNTSLTTNDDIVALWNGTSWSELAREGGLIDTFVPTLPGGLWDDGMDTPRLGGGSPLWHSDLVDWVPAITVGDEFSLLPGGGLLREGFTVPVNLAGGATNTWENFTIGETYVSSDGLSVLVLGDTDAATTDDQILAINNVVVLQENQIIPGSGFTQPIDNANGIVQAWLDNGGNWWARGNNDNPASATIEQDWIVRNGVVVAVSNNPLDPRSEVVPGSGEHWDDAGFSDCFFGMDGSIGGAYAIAGVTDNPDALRDGVVVHDSGTGQRTIVAREGDPIDTDEDGLYDDDRFFNTFGNDDVLVLENGEVMFTATIKTGAGTVVDQGVFKVKVGGGHCVRRNGTGINLLECNCMNAPVLGGNFTVGLTPNANTLATITALGAGPLPPTPLFGGELLIDPTILELYLGAGDQTFPVPSTPALAGATAWLQGARYDLVAGTPTIVLLNALDATIGN